MAGRTKGEKTVRLVMNITETLDKAIDMRVKRLNEDGAESYDRSRVLRAVFAREFRAELAALKS